jgi:fructokinase
VRTVTAPTIAGTGLFALDVILRLDGSTASPRLGGSAGNVLAILGAFGWSAAPVGMLGDDPAAEMICRDFSLVGADTKWLRRSSTRTTPVIFQHQLKSGSDHVGATHRFTFACPSCGTRRRPLWEDDGESALSGQGAPPPASVFYLDRPTRLGVRLAEHYARQGATVVFEPSAVGEDEDLFARAMRVARIVKYADERLPGLGGFELRPGSVEIQTRGADGLRFRTLADRPAWTELGAYRLPRVHDTAGAGDWCTAGLLFELFGHQSASRRIDTEMLARGLAFGQVLATLNCVTEGARGLLAAWTPERIVRAARELADVRLRSTPGAMPVHDTELQDLANDVSRSARSNGSDADSFYCCATP